MSHATLAKMHGLDWKQDHRISLGCTWDGALERYMKDHPEIKKIVFALDNDFDARDKRQVGFQLWSGGCREILRQIRRTGLRLRYPSAPPQGISTRT
ncbi:MAG TPA: hypothetical protein VN456_10305 [Desulfosporosinus sp.]|nr:hypothetical protein [Desulfosporosinus sp.]